ncbi:glutamine synthetase family protein [Chitinimonas sp. BJYL2]|uniref:glutamine synthetase family protein n=1 Tax=Chitinimonas sp. BJYL2 TaxID=2976696 RepID=UPI0022B3767E|nr:glutamine synthetase family protein [Chitinimonas sp. BJYL2]
MKQPAQTTDLFQPDTVREVECLVPDINGYPRGKALPGSAFAKGQELRLCRAVAIHTATGDWADYEFSGEGDPDMKLIPVMSTLKPVPWASRPRALCIHDCIDLDGQPTPIAPRNVLKNVLSGYAVHGWSPVVAPELEFYLLAPHTDPHQPLQPPTNARGRSENGQQGFGFIGLNDHAAFWDQLYAALDVLGIRYDTFVHELGPGQFEINLWHGDAVEVADQTFLFKYALKEIAAQHGMQAIFMAKPMAGQPGSAMHIHQSVVDARGQNIFSGANGESTALFEHFIAGQQQAIAELMPVFCPFVNSYRRFAKHMAAPVNLSWGYDNRSVGIRVPHAGPAARRVENRIPGVDANPYLVLAASLAAGLWGMQQQLRPTAAAEGTVFNQISDAPTLPGTLDEALARMRASALPGQLLGDTFTASFIAVKQVELDSFWAEITPWERQYLTALA